jgi:hypothetical protein
LQQLVSHGGRSYLDDVGCIWEILLRGGVVHWMAVQGRLQCLLMLSAAGMPVGDQEPVGGRAAANWESGFYGPVKLIIRRAVIICVVDLQAA